MSMTALLKDAQQNSAITVSEITYIRTIFALIASALCLLIARKNPFKVPRDLVGPLFVRSVAGASASITLVKAVELVPLTIFQIVTKSDAFLTGVLAFIWLGERLSLFQIVCMVMTFGGIVIITFAKQEIESDEEAESNETEERDFY